MKIEWNKVTWYSKILAIILFILVFYLGFYLGKENEKLNVNKTIVKNIEKVEAILKDGRQCYTYSHKATKDEPYDVNEFIDININNNTVEGTKTGNQSGPDMTNGYSGTLTGIIDNNTINTLFSYTIEGSKNQEKEIYRAREDQLGIDKLRYPLIEKSKMLVPDTTKEYKTMLYSRVGCYASN